MMSESNMIYKTEDDLQTMLDGLAGGEQVKATWAIDNLTITAEGPVTINETVVCDNKTIKTEGPVTIDKMIWCDRPIRWENGVINNALTSLEVIREEEVTATRDDEKSLYALVDSLEEGWEVTVELRDEKGSKTFTGSVMVDDVYRLLVGNERTPLRWSDGILHIKLHSVTVRRPVVYRWKRYVGE